MILNDKKAFFQLFVKVWCVVGNGNEHCLYRHGTSLLLPSPNLRTKLQQTGDLLSLLYSVTREEKMLAIVTLKRQSKRKKTLKDLFESFCNKANVQERKKGPSKGLSSPFYFSFPLWLLLFNSIQLSDQSHITSIALYGPLKWFLMPKIPKMLNECKT